MPFVDPENSQSPTDTRKIFIGRTNELDFFMQSILQPEKPTYNIISVSGNAGVGKSALLAQLIDKALTSGFKEYCLIAQVGERQVTPLSMMEKIADQFRVLGYPFIHFETALRKYREMEQKLQSEHEAFLSTRATERVSLSLDDIFVNDEDAKNVKKADDHFLREHTYHHLFRGTEQKDEQIGELTKVFVDELNQLASTPVVLSSHQKKHQRRILLFFDPFEQLANEAVPWLLNHFLEAKISTNIVLIMAGHVPIERSYPKYLRNWLPYRDSNTIYFITLNSFSQEETRQYLTAHGITDSSRIDILWKLSRGLPMYLCHLAANPQGEIDPMKDVVEAILRGISDNEQVKKQLALDVSLFSKPFNQDDLEALTYITEDDRPTLYRWLTMQSFVSSSPLDGLYRYHELTREIFSRYLYQAPKRCQATRRALAEYYQRLLDKTPMDKPSAQVGKGVRYPQERLELVFALTIQLLLLPEESDHISAIEHILYAYSYTDKEQDSEIMKVLDKLSQEDPNNWANADARQVAKHLLEYIMFAKKSTRSSQEFVRVSSYLLGKVAHKPSFPSELLADIHFRAGRAYYNLDKFEQVLIECNYVLEIDAQFIEAYILRGEIYNKLRDYTEALADFQFVLKLDQENAHALYHRGQIYHRFLSRYEEALQDLDRAIKLDSDFKHQGCEEIGQILYTLRRYQESIDVFIEVLKAEPTCSDCWISLAKTYQALHLDNEIPKLLMEVPVSKSNSAAVIACRAEALSTTKHYDDALEHLTDAIKLDPKNAEILIQRGNIYGKLGRYEEALNEFTSAINLKPNDSLILAIRGQAFRNLNRYEESLQDFHRAIRLNPKNGWLYIDRGKIFSAMKYSKEALQDFNHAIELDPETEHNAQEEKGLVFQSLGKHQEAVEVLTKALAKQIVCSVCWTTLAETYEVLYPHSEIPKLLREIFIPDAEIASVIDCRGEALRVTNHYEEALADLDYAIELDPDNAFAFMSRGEVHYNLCRYEEALRDFDNAIKLNPDYKHPGYRNSGQVYLLLGKYHEAIETYIKALAVLPACRTCWLCLTRACEAVYPRGEVPKLLREISIPEADTASVIANRAGAMRTMGYYEEALLDFTKAIEMEPNRVETIILRGQVYNQLKRHEKALADFTRAIELKPNQAIAVFYRGQTHRHLNHYMEAVHDLDHAIQLASTLKHDSQKEKGLVFYSQGKYQKAIDTIIKALTIRPTCKSCWTSLTRAYEAIHPRNEVPKLLRNVSIPEADTASVIASRAGAMRTMGYYEEALAELNHAITLDGTIIESYYDDIGLLFSYLKQYEKAIDSYKIGLKQDSSNYVSLYNIAIAMIRWKGPIAAQTDIKAAYTALQALRYKDEDGAALYGLGGLEALLGNSDQALDFLQQAVLLEDNAEEWARHDIAWLDLRENQRFKALTSDNSKEVAYAALNAQSQQNGVTHLILQDQASSLQSVLTDSTSVQISMVSSPTRGNLVHNPTVVELPISLRSIDIDRLADILAKYAASSFEGSRRFFKVLVSRTDIPQRWIQEAADVWTGNANHDAQTLISWSISKGINPNNPKFTTLGSLLQKLLPDIGLDDARIIAALIFVYHLYLEKQLREDIAIHYQIPQMIPASGQSDMSISGAWQGPVPTEDLQLQSWLKSEPDILDVGLLIGAIQQATAVCRIELPQKRRYGTGFLIAPNLLLTNYHILKFDDNDDLEVNVHDAILRFGCIMDNDGKESQGQTFKLVASNPVLRWSQTDKLDYILLHVEDAIIKTNDIKHVQYNLQPPNEHIGMHILQHPEGESMKLAINTNGIVRIYEDRGLIQYVTRARKGASGSPCFNENWKVVALHHAERATAFGSVREGILFRSIYKEIKEYL